MKQSCRFYATMEATHFPFHLYITHAHIMFHTKDTYQIVKITLQPEFDGKESFDSLVMLEDAINYKLINQQCYIFVNMSKYGVKTHYENHYCVGQLEIGMVGYLFNHPRI